MHSLDPYIDQTQGVSLIITSENNSENEVPPSSKVSGRQLAAGGDFSVPSPNGCSRGPRQSRVHIVGE